VKWKKGNKKDRPFGALTFQQKDKKMKKETPTQRNKKAIEIIEQKLDLLAKRKGYIAEDLFCDCIDAEEFESLMWDIVHEQESLWKIKNALEGGEE
jgi:hypothetical protein